MAPIAGGICADTIAAVSISSVVASLLFDVRPRDPAIIGAVMAVVAGVAVVACFVAARQGLKLDPAAALRSE